MTALYKDTKLKFPHIHVIDASAGSGKTETLTKRFVQFLLSSEIKKKNNNSALPNLLAITFTNNAAREMKQRILRWLKLLAFGKPCRERDEMSKLVNLQDTELTNKADQIIDRLFESFSDFHVQTIDSFMAAIMRSSVLELDMPIENTITETYAGLIDLSLSLLFDNIGGNISEDDIQEFLELMMQEAPPTYPWNPIARIRTQFENFLAQEGKMLEPITFNNSWSRIKELSKEIHKAYRECRSLGLKEKSPRSCKVIEDIKSNDVVGLTRSYSKNNLPFKKDRKKETEYARMQQSWIKIAPLVHEMALLVSISHYYHYGVLYNRFKQYLEQTKYQMETIHFDDVNKKLSKYISKICVPEIYYRLGDWLYHFLLDEFQDTDRVQWENLQPLLEEAYAKGGSLFAVGDTKQAIYMFRKADYKIMRYLVDAIKQKGNYCRYLPKSVLAHAQVTQLSKNFRSGNAILEYVEQLFKKRLKELGLVEEDLTGLTTYVQEPARHLDYGKSTKALSGYVRTILIEDSETNPEQEVLLEIIEDTTTRYDPRDIAILTRKNESVENVVDWLTERNKQAASFSSLDIRKRKIIMELVSLLQWLDAPLDDLSFASFLLGDVFKLALATNKAKINHQNLLDDIIHWSSVKSRHRVSLYVWFRDHSCYREIWDIFFNDIFVSVGFLPMYDLVTKILRKFDVFNNFREETGFLVRFLEAIGSFEAQGMNNLRDFIQTILQGNQDTSLEIILPGYINAIKVMTFHKSKGLGFPVVINLIYESRVPTTNMYFSKIDDELLIHYIRKKQADRIPALGRIYYEYNNDVIRQDLNLLYVANTRAKNELYNIVVKKSKKEKKRRDYTDLFEPYEAGRKVSGKRHELDKKSAPLEVLLPASANIPFIHEEDVGWHIGRHEETKKGEFYHQVLALITYLPETYDNYLQQLITQTACQRRETYDQIKVMEMLKSFITIPQVRKWFDCKEGREIEQEAEYVDQSGRLLRIDRVIKDKNEIQIIDFKTGAPKQYYDKQMKDYKKILSNIHRDKDINGYLAYIDSGKVVRVE